MPRGALLVLVGLGVAFATATVRGGSALGAPKGAAGQVGASGGAPTLQTTSGDWFLSPAEVARMRVNVKTQPWARLAWQKTKAQADAALTHVPKPADPHGDYRPQGVTTCSSGQPGWYCGLYLPGLYDGRDARALALAYAITGDRKYALKAKEFLLAWARTYNPPPPTYAVGHYVAEPVGFMLKGFQAYALVNDVFSAAEEQQFRRWAALFVPRGKALTDAVRDHPWAPEAPYGNSATWARSLATLSAAVVGGRTLKQTLAWNWSHTTAAGNDYGWEALVSGVMLPNGHMVEEDVRKSIFYALYTLEPMMLIADVARHVHDSHDLWRFTTSDGKGIRKAISHYVPYLVGERSWPYQDIRSPDSISSEFRAVMEVAHDALPKWLVASAAVTFGGWKVRGSNEDPHIMGYGAIVGSLVG